MPGDLSETLAEEIHRAAFENEPLSVLPVGGVYIAAHTGSTGEDGGSNEVTATDYGRVETAPADWNVTVGTGEVVVENDDDDEMQFPVAESNWGSVEEISVWDAASGGNCLWVKGEIDPTSIEENDRLSFEPGDLVFTVG